MKKGKAQRFRKFPMYGFLPVVMNLPKVLASLSSLSDAKNVVLLYTQTNYRVLAISESELIYLTFLMRKKLNISLMPQMLANGGLVLVCMF